MKAVRTTALFVLSALVLAFPFPMPHAVATIVPDRDAPLPDRAVLVRYHGSDTIVPVRFPKNTDIASVIAALKKDPAVSIAEPDGRVRAAAIPNDPLYPTQKPLTIIELPTAWDITTGSGKTIVAVLDSGLDINHPDIKSNLWMNSSETPGNGVDDDGDGYVDDVNGWDFINDIPDVEPKFGGAFTDAGIHHGTVIAGIIAAEGNNRMGVSGVSWRASLMPLRVLNNRGEGDILTVIKAIEYAINHRADVINMSFVGETDSQLLREAVKRASDAGIVVVAASGNDEQERHGTDLTVRPMYPTCYARAKDFTLISVASLEGLASRAPYSNYGNCITVSAPGSDFVAPQVVRYEQPGFDQFYGTGWVGTSLSTALVSGVSALLKSVNPSATPADIAHVITSTCFPIDSENPGIEGKLGCGRLDAGAAVQKMALLAKNSGQALIGEVSPPPQIALVPLDGKMPLRFFSPDGSRDESLALLPFDPFRIGYSLTASPDGSLLVFGAGAGGGPQVRLFNRDLKLVGQFFAYDKRFRGGVSVAVADVDGDGSDDIVTVPGPGGGPHVRIFDLEGHMKKQFFAFEPSLRSGLRLAVGDMNGDGRADIVVTPQRAKTEVRVFTADGAPMARFEPYAKMSVPSVTLAVGDVEGAGTPQIITAPASGIAPVRVFSAFGQLKKSFSPFDQKFRGGVNIAVGDLNEDRIDDIITVPLSSGGPHVRIFSGAGALIGQFFPLPKTFRQGLRITVVP